MMQLWLCVMVLTSTHWRAAAIPLILQTEYRFDASACQGAYACYYHDEISIDLVASWPEIRHIAFHEMQHRMTQAYSIWPKTHAQWCEFADLVAGLVASGKLDPEQQSILESWAGCADCQLIELHAELPWILDGTVPAEFAAWYPWLEFK